MDAHDDYLSREHRFVLGFDADSGKHYLAFPVTIGVVDYDEQDYVSQENRYGLGLDTDSGKHFLAIPVTNGVADYNEYYAVTDEVFARYLADPQAALAFAEECRRREHDDLLILKPGWNRGIPI